MRLWREEVNKGHSPNLLKTRPSVGRKSCKLTSLESVSADRAVKTLYGHTQSFIISCLEHENDSHNLNKTKQYL